MTVTVLCLETGAFDDTFANELAAALDVPVLNLRPLELGIAEWHLFCGATPECDGASGSPALQKTTVEIEDHSIRIAKCFVESFKGGVLVVGWSVAAPLAKSSSSTSVCVRAPQPKGAWSAVRRMGYDASNLAAQFVGTRDPHASRFPNACADPKWLHDDNFHLVLDSGRVSATDCRREILALVERRTAQQTVDYAHQATQSRERNRLPAWPNLKGCAVSVGSDDVRLAGIASQEDAIARIERHLHGANELPPPANPLCRGTSD
jgi:hypothetical protein